ncbi:MAG: NAD-binding protein [Chloroflexi bacterium]|nr:NAD-binding protein [Chloroflexota bacterium]
MFVVIVGAGAVGRHLAEVLAQEKQQVVLVEKDASIAAKVAQETSIEVVEGDGDDPDVLQRAGASGADVVVAVTGEDEDNLVACTLAKFQFSAKRVIARVNNPKNAWMFGKDTGVDVAVSQADVMTRLLVEEMTLSDIVTLLRLRLGEVALVEKSIGVDSKAAGSQIKGLPFPENAVCVAVLQGGKVLVPRPDLTVQVGDEVIVLTTAENEAKLAEIL